VVVLGVRLVQGMVDSARSFRFKKSTVGTGTRAYFWDKAIRQGKKKYEQSKLRVNLSKEHFFKLKIRVFNS